MGLNDFCNERKHDPRIDRRADIIRSTNYSLTSLGGGNGRMNPIEKIRDSGSKAGLAQFVLLCLLYFGRYVTGYSHDEPPVFIWTLARK